GGKTFKPCGEYSPVGANSAQALPKWRDAALYWLVDGGVIVTTDKGKTGKTLGEGKDPPNGPPFGRGPQQKVVLAQTGGAERSGGVVESSDGGMTWSKPLPPPKEMKGVGGLSWLEYDPKNDVLFLMKMGSDLYRLARKQ